MIGFCTLNGSNTRLTAQTFQNVSLSGVANSALDHLASPPVGTQTYQGIPFTLLSGSRVTVELSTARSLNVVNIPTTVANPTNVYLLCNGFFVYSTLRNVVTGRVTLTFANAATTTFDLIPGVNIRETWDYTTVPFLTTITRLTQSATWQNGYIESQSRGGRPAQGFLDIVTVPIPTNLRSQNLTNIRFERITAGITTGTQSFGLKLNALTVGTQAPSIPPVNANDSLALVALYNSTGGAAWANRSGWLTTTPVSRWYGVSTANARVTQITLNGNNLRGTLPAQIGNLTALTRFEASGNLLTGTIPAGIGSLSTLTYLDLSSNNFSGVVPSLSGAPNLQTLWLSWNQLSGTFPASLTSLRSLRQLSLAYNNFVGRIPAEVSTMTGLRELYLDHNNFSDALPTLSALTNLAQLDVSFNALFALNPLPTSLTTLRINNNRLFDNTPPTGIGGQVTAFPQAFRHFSISGAQTPFVTSATVTQTPVTITANDNATAYQWSRNGVLISGATSRSYNITQSGAYTCSLTNNVGRVFSTSAANITVNAPTPAPPTITSFTPTSGAAGTTVQITGTNFVGVTSVRIGGTPTTFFTANSATQITANVGAGSTGVVSVTTPAGTAVSSQSFTFNSPSPSPSPTGVNLYTYQQTAAQTLTSFDASATTFGSGSGVDDQTYQGQIGFAFPYNGASYTSLTISANGWVSFAGQPMGTCIIFPPLSVSGGEGVISMTGGDLLATANGRLWSRTVGTAPNRQFIVQWSNFGFYNSAGTADGVFSSELVLNENGRIDMRHGACSIPSTASGWVQCGLRGRTTTDYYNVLRASTWSNMARGLYNSCGVACTSTDNFGSRTISFIPPQSVTPMPSPTPQPTPQPVAPQIVTPTNNATAVLDSTGNITLQWTTVPNATRYDFVVSGNSTFNSTPIYGSSVAAPTTSFRLHSGWFPGITSAGTVYYFRVTAVVGSTATPSPVVSATIATPVRIVSVTPQTGLAGQSVTLTITGQNSNFVGATAVRLVQSSGGGTSAIGSITSRTATSLQATFTLPSAQGAYNVVVENAPRLATLTSGFSVTSNQPDPPTTSQFNPLVHGFSFSNSDSWYNSNVNYATLVNYSSAPYTTWPAEFRAKAVNGAAYWWEDHAVAYSRFQGNTTYLPGNIPTLEAINAWWAGGQWGGSCFGFSMTSIHNFAGTYSAGVPYQIQPNRSIAALIHRHQCYQRGARLYSNESPNQTVQRVRQAFQTNNRSIHPAVAFFWVNSSGRTSGHSVVPYRITSETNAQGEIIDRVFVYENNSPGNTNQQIIVNRTRNTWSSSTWGLTDLTGNFYYDATAQSVPPMVYAGRPLRLLHSEEDTPLQVVSSITFSPARSAAQPTVVITNSQGNTILNNGKDPLGEDIGIAGASPIMSLTGSEEDSLASPIRGYDIPAQGDGYLSVSYTATPQGNDAEPRAEQSIGFNTGDRFNSRLVWTTPSNTSPQILTVDARNDLAALRAPAGGGATSLSFTVGKTDETRREWENLVRIDNTSLCPSDSLDIRLINDGEQFVITNYNCPKNYDLTLYRSGSERRFEGLRIGQNSTHIIRVNDWSNLIQSGITLIVDNRNDQKIDSVATLQRDVITSIRDNKNIMATENLKVYPNPTSREVNVAFTLAAPSRTRIEVVNLLGQVVATLFEGMQNSGRQTLPFSLETVPNGAYIIRVSIGSEHYVQPLRIFR